MFHFPRFAAHISSRVTRVAHRHVQATAFPSVRLIGKTPFMIQPVRLTPAALMHSSASKLVELEPAVEPEATTMKPRRFADIKAIHPNSKKALKNVFKYDTMSIVQDAVLSRLPDNKDIFVKAKTGTGKTLAFLVAALETATGGSVVTRPEGNLILVVSPTRELAHQIASEAKRLVKFYPYGVHCLVGGDSKIKQLRQLDSTRGDIIVATPGRLLDILDSSKHVQRLLEQTKVLVLDEADQLIDMGFKQEVQRILAFLPKERQTMLFSATLSPEIRNTIGKFALSSEYELVDTVGEEEVNTHLHVKQSAIIAPYNTQMSHLRNLLHSYPAANSGKTIVFLPTTKSTALYAKMLQFLMPQRNIMELHSKMNQAARTRVASRFRKAMPGSILVTSDVSARGVDYPDVSLVVQVGMPSSREQYIHRLGRTGRAGKDGEGVIIIAPFETSFVKDEISDLPVQNLIPPPPNEEEKEDTERIMAYVLKHRVDPEEINELYTSYLGYYSGRMVQLNQPRSDALDHGKEFLSALGVTEIPHLSPRFIEQLGLKNRDRRSSSTSSSRDRSSNSRYGQDRGFDRRGDNNSRFSRRDGDDEDRRGTFNRFNRQKEDGDDRRGGSRFNRRDDNTFDRSSNNDSRFPRRDGNTFDRSSSSSSRFNRRDDNADRSSSSSSRFNRRDDNADRSSSSSSRFNRRDDNTFDRSSSGGSRFNRQDDNADRSSSSSSGGRFNRRDDNTDRSSSRPRRDFSNDRTSRFSRRDDDSNGSWSAKRTSDRVDKRRSFGDDE